ncbi:uncharacterized protein LOC659605 [Tribolium castaneum]|uniref:uncharacterized protein LOC659605 n=1 Tax=Tribolium castaneum TaxID=7070 RepID=UPI0030FE6746
MPLRIHKNKIVFEIFLVASISLMCFTPLFFYNRTTTTISLIHIEDAKHHVPIPALVSNNKCLIPDFSQMYFQQFMYSIPKKYTPCNRKNYLTFVTKSENTATLHVKQQNGFYPEVSCCYSNISRNFDRVNPDDTIKISKCRKFTKNVTLATDFVLVKCDTGSVQYKQVHAAITAKKTTKNSDIWPPPFSVLILGIDKISRLSFIRNFPKTRHYLTSNNKWVSLNGYAKVSDDTFTNILALLSGCKTMECDLIWSEFEKYNYTTAFGEDDVWSKTFTFHKQLTDYYFRPYFIANEKYPTVELNKMFPCPDRETPFERLLDLAKDFSVTFKNHPSFALFWIKTATVGTFPKLDYSIRALFRHLNRKGVFANTFVFFLSDQGRREGKNEFTNVGWLEEKLPFVYVLVPKKFQEIYSEEFRFLKLKQNELTTPFDLYMTLQDIMVLTQVNQDPKPSQSCPRCESLFMDVTEKSCLDSEIENRSCPCDGFVLTNLDDLVVRNASLFIVNKVNEFVDQRMCRSYELRKVLSSSASWSSGYKKLLISVQTYPYSVFEAFVTYVDKVFELDGEIKRLDFAIVRCVSDSFLKKYCVCKGK